MTRLRARMLGALPHVLRATFAAASIACAIIGCAKRDRAGEHRGAGVRDSDGVEHVPGYDAPLVVLHAGSLARPLRTALDSFTARTAIPVVTLSAGSVEAARRITDLRDVPDLIALADEEVFPAMLVPRYVGSYYTFARNRMVIALAPGRSGVKIDSTNWYRLLSARDAEVGRSNPDLDPAGYRALMVLRLAELAYRNPWITRAVLARSPARNVRPKSADLVALLQTGALDYAFLYESSARAAGLGFVELPASMNLGSDSFSASYARARVRIAGRARGDSIEVRGAPIRYALAVPREAPHAAAAHRLEAFLLSAAGLKAMRDAGLDVVPPVEHVPPIVRLLAPAQP